MSDRIQQPRTWLTVGLLALLALGVYLVAAPNRGQSTLAANVEETTAGVQAGEPVVAGSAVTILTEDDRPRRLKSATNTWNTNWNRHIIDYNDLLSGGPPRDGIPSIDEPNFVSPSQAQDWLADNEPVIALDIDGEARAYPLQILTWHEIVNDTVGRGRRPGDSYLLPLVQLGHYL